MKKDILKKQLKKLGIVDGSIIKVRFDCDFEYFLYEDDIFKPLGIAPFTEEDLKQLLNHSLGYEVISYKLNTEKVKKFLIIMTGVWFVLIITCLIIKSLLGLG